MAIRGIVRYPDPSLKRRCDVQPKDPEALARDLVDTMRASPATVGLAAPQIGERVRAFVLDVSGHRRATSSNGLVVVFDPVIAGSRGEDLVREGCLSVPDLTANVRRATSLTLRGTDGRGEARSYEMEGFEARAALHELDHLDGVLILDRVASANDLFARKVYRSAPEPTGGASSAGPGPRR